MGKNRWPTLGHARPSPTIEHAANLRAEFEEVLEFVRGTAVDDSKFPNGISSLISRGVLRGIEEGVSKGCCQPFTSGADKDTFRRVMLASIRKEAAHIASNRIPMRLFNTLYESYVELNDKFAAHPTLNNRKRGPTPAGESEIELEIELEMNSVRGDSPNPEQGSRERSLETSTSSQAEIADSDYDTDADHIMMTFRDIERQAQMLRSELHEFQSDSGEQDQSDEDIDGSSSEEESRKDAKDDQIDVEMDAKPSVGEVSLEADSEQSRDEHTDDDGKTYDNNEEENVDTSIEKEEDMQDFLAEETEKHNIQMANTRIMCLRLSDQACIDFLSAMPPGSLPAFVFNLFKKVAYSGQTFSNEIELSELRRLDDKNFHFKVHVGTYQDFLRLSTLANWNQMLERRIIPPPRIYSITMKKVERSSMTLGNLKEKTEVVRELVDVRKVARRLSHESSRRSKRLEISYYHDICDIHWCKGDLAGKHADVVIHVLTAEKANDALDRGLSWQGKTYDCEVLNAASRLQRCSRCSVFGHKETQSSAAERCARCSQPHSSKHCTSATLKCPLCGGAHAAIGKICPERRRAHDAMRFDVSSSSPPGKRKVPAQSLARPLARAAPASTTQPEADLPSPVSLSESLDNDPRFKTEDDEPTLRMRPSQDRYPDTATLLKQLKELEALVRARDSAQREKSEQPRKAEAGGKRKAEEFLMSGGLQDPVEEPKRIKVEDDDSSRHGRLYRMPSIWSEPRPS